MKVRISVGVGLKLELGLRMGLALVRVMLKIWPSLDGKNLPEKLRRVCTPVM